MQRESHMRVFQALVLSLVYTWCCDAYGVEGYYKDVFIDAGVHLNSITDLIHFEDQTQYPWGFGFEKTF